MESTFIKAPYTKRFVIEDSITKVTSDGKPHEMMTIIAALSGLLTALVILGVLLFFLISKKFNSVQHQCHRCSLSSSVISTTPSGYSTDGTDIQSNRTSIETICENIGKCSRSPSVAALYSGNLHSNLATVFQCSELSLQSCMSKGAKDKKLKRAHWPDEKEGTCIQMERIGTHEVSSIIAEHRADFTRN